MRILLRITLSTLIGIIFAGSAHAEEFTGPFPSWKNVKTDYGAVGDGKTDDTAAIQRGLDDLTKHEKSCVLFLPAGKYRITRTLKTMRKAHADCQGVTVIGEDPATAVLTWDGEDGGTLLQWDAWYSRISRLTLDGQSRADALLVYGPAFSTYNETSELYFRDAKSGLVFGGPKTAGQAENEVLRCRFARCGVGIQTVNWNSMDIWVWYCHFEDCGRGVHNVMGNWHVWRSIFLHSTVADLSTQNLMAFSAVNNISVGSKCFMDFDTGHSWGSPTSITGNAVIDPTGDWAIRLGNAGPYLVVDNLFRLTNKSRAIRMTWGDQTLAGNIYSKPDAVEEHGRFRRINEKIEDGSTMEFARPLPTAVASHRDRKIFEVPAGADGAAIQQAIDQAAKLAGQRPIVHLPMGAYKLSQTIIVPANCDVQIVGDGAGETATRLVWAGPTGGVALQLEGPALATLRDFYIHAPTGRAIIVSGIDQVGGRVRADQLNASGPSDSQSQQRGHTTAVRISGLDHAQVQLRALQGSGNAGKWLEVIGGDSDNTVSVFTGATGSAAGQYDVRHGGHLVVRAVYHERSSDSLSGLRLADRGTLSIDATRFSYATSEKTPTVEIDGFHGLFTLATCILLPVETKQTCRFEIRGDGSNASVLSLNSQFWVELPGTTSATVWQNRATPPARGGLIGCNINSNNKQAAPKGFEFLPNLGDDPDPAKSKFGSGPLPDLGTVDDATILRHLAPLRAALVWTPEDDAAPGVTNLQIHRVMAAGGYGATVEFRAK